MPTAEKGTEGEDEDARGEARGSEEGEAGGDLLLVCVCVCVFLSMCELKVEGKEVGSVAGLEEGGELGELHGGFEDGGVVEEGAVVCVYVCARMFELRCV